MLDDADVCDGVVVQIVSASNFDFYHGSETVGEFRSILNGYRRPFSHIVFSLKKCSKGEPWPLRGAKL
jgi:hypothetical protein